MPAAGSRGQGLRESRPPCEGRLGSGAACAWGLPEQGRLPGSGSVPRAEGGWVVGMCLPGLIPALQLKLKQIPDCTGELGGSGRSFCAGNQKLSCFSERAVSGLWLRPGACQLLVLPTGAAQLRDMAPGPFVKGVRAIPLDFWRALTTAGCP